MKAVLATAAIVVPLLADSRTEAELRLRLAASEAARIEAARDKATLNAKLAILAAQNEARSVEAAKTNKAAILEHHVTALVTEDVALRAKELAEQNLRETAKTTEVAAAAAKSSAKVESVVQPVWVTLFISVIGLIGSSFGLKKIRDTNALVLKVELSINSRMDQFLKVKDDLLEVRASAERAAGRLEGSQVREHD